MSRQSDPQRRAFWSELIERSRQSGLSVAEFCKQADVSTASFYLWQRKLRGPLAGPATRSTAARPPKATSAELVPVRFVADGPTKQPLAAGFLEIELPGAIRLRVPPGCVPESLRLVLSILRELQDGESR
jgi:hypothetical protein